MTIIDPDQDPRRPSHHEMAVRAHELWELRGRPLFVEGVPEADWRDAEREWQVHEHRSLPCKHGVYGNACEQCHPYHKPQQIGHGGVTNP